MLDHNIAYGHRHLSTTLDKPVQDYEGLRREWITSLVTQICMTIGNRDRYRAANEDMMRLLCYLRDLDLPDENENRSQSGYDDITDL